MGRGLPAVRSGSPRSAWLVPAGCSRSGAVDDGDGDLVAGLVGRAGDRSGGAGVDTGAAGHRAVRHRAGGGLVQRAVQESARVGDGDADGDGVGLRVEGELRYVKADDLARLV